MSDFGEFVSKERQSAILKSRINQLAEEGYQHELNAEFIKDQIRGLDADADRVPLLTELDMANERVLQIASALRWHRRKLEDLDGEHLK